MSALRARCPYCTTLTAVVLDDGYECHACGAEFTAGLVRVPRAWGSGGEAMAKAARLLLPYPDPRWSSATRSPTKRDALAAASASAGTRSWAGAVRAYGRIKESAEHLGRLGVAWLDAHGDLNTAESSPSGNAWGMPLRVAIDSGAVAPEDVALVGARNLDPPELSISPRPVSTTIWAVLSAASMPSTSPSMPTSSTSG